MRKCAVHSFLLLLFLAPACSQGETIDLDAEVEALLERDREWSAAAASSDLEAIFDYWAEDAVLYPPGAPAAVGKAAIREFIAAQRALPGFSISWEPQSAVVAASGDMAYTQGEGMVQLHDAEGNPVRNPAKYTVIWRKEADGVWRSVVDMFNFNEPPPASQSAPVEGQ